MSNGRFIDYVLQPCYHDHIIPAFINWEIEDPELRKIIGEIIDDIILLLSEKIRQDMPQQLSDDKLQEIVATTLLEIGAKTPADLGKAMKEIMPKVKGRADGNRVRQMIALKLSG